MISCCGRVIILFLTSAVLSGELGLVRGESDRAELINTKNKYNLLVAIHDTVSGEYADRIISGLQEYMTNASYELYKATNDSISLANITVLVPSSWNVTSLNVTPAVTESYERANIIVDKPSVDYGYNPYTKQIAGCGKRGEYIHLTPKYIYETQNTAVKISKDVGRAIAHELGHLLWGLYDEYPLLGQQKFYRNASGEIRPVGCTAAIPGGIYYKGNMTEKCVKENPKYLDNSTGLFVAECIFIPNEDEISSDTVASLMNIHYLGKINKFCGINGTDPNNRHNDEAPNLHNRLCKGRSAAEIIHEVEGKVENTESKFTKPTFTYVKKSSRRLIILIDLNGNITRENRTNILETLSDYVRNTLEKGTQLAILNIGSSGPEVHLNFTIITNDTVRRIAMQSIENISNSTGTIGCIECGIKTANEILNGTDGTRNILIIASFTVNVNRSTWKDLVVSQGNILDFIYLSSSGNRLFRKLTRGAGGQYCFIKLRRAKYKKNREKIIAKMKKKLRNCFFNIETKRTQNVDIQQIYRKDINLQKSKKGTLILDSATGIGVSDVMFKANSVADLLFATLSNGSKTLQINSTSEAKFQNVKPGMWNYLVYCTCDSVEISVISSTPKTADVKTIRITAQISAPEVNFKRKDKTSPKLSIFATVLEGLDPVLGGTVFADVEYGDDSENTIELQLLDNGAGADAIKDDGTYSAYFVNIRKSGTFNVNVRFENTNGTATIKTRSSTTSSGAFRVDYLDSSGDISSSVTYSNIEPMTRMQSAGSFDVDNYDETVDYYAPSRITDLNSRVTWHDKSVTLEWTAVGDDLDRGKATSYKINYDRHFQNLRTNFSETNSVNAVDILKGNVTNPSTAGVSETFVIRMPHAQNGQVYVFAVKAVDDSGQHSEVSNIVYAAFIDPEVYKVIEPSTKKTMATTVVETTEIITTTNTVTTEQSKGDEYDVLEIVTIAVPCATAFLIVCIVVCLIIYCRRTSKNKEPIDESTVTPRDNEGNTENEVRRPRRFIKVIQERISFHKRTSGVYESSIERPEHESEIKTSKVPSRYIKSPSKKRCNNRASGSYAQTIQPDAGFRHEKRGLFNLKKMSTYKTSIDKDTDYRVGMATNHTSGEDSLVNSNFVGNPELIIANECEYYNTRARAPPLPEKKRANYTIENNFF